VQIFNWGELDDGTSFMAMEYLAGRTLAELISAQAPVDAELAVDIAEQICTALSEAHAAGIVHRDLKPSNIMLIERGEQRNFVKVLDFGVAKLEGADITRSGALFGTPQYMSPEQLRGEGLDGRSDLYSLGVILYELLAGTAPFSSPTAVGFITAHLHDPPPPLPSDVPAELAEVVMMLLAKDPSERPADALAVVAELRSALGGRSPAARRRARRRAARRILIATTIAVGVAALGYGGWMVWEWRSATQDELARERARAAALERKVEETQDAIRQAREDARNSMSTLRKASDGARELREQVERQAPNPRRVESLDPQMRAMFNRSRAQLEADLRRVFETRRIPPSEISEVWKGHDARVAALAAGTISEAELRDQLISLIDLYEKSFASKQPGDSLPLERLVDLFLTMPTKSGLDTEQRQALLTAIDEEHRKDPELLDIDRPYYKRLAVAKLVRDHSADSRTRELPIAEPQVAPKPPDLSEPGSTTADAALPDPEAEPADAQNFVPATLPSLEGM
jgi:hypothetical protein